MSPDISGRLSDFLKANLLAVSLGVLGLATLGFGIFDMYKPGSEVLSDQDVQITSQEESSSTVFVDVSGAVKSPGVYELEPTSRIRDAIERAGGFTDEADSLFVAKNLNLAQVVKDGSKIYIPLVSSSQDINSLDSNQETSSLVNINTASQGELEELPGIGPVTARKIIDNRPFGSIEELLDKKVVGLSAFEKIKESISVY